MVETLSLRQLNRATLARQMLLERESLPILAAVERLAGLQAQIPNPPYIGLWTRLQNFQRDDLTRLMEQRQIVRTAMMRSTLHLVTAADFRRFRLTLQPALVKALSAFFGSRSKGLDVDQLVAAAQAHLAEKPRTTGELRSRLLEIAPGRDGDALAYLVRTYLPLVQLAPGGTWGSGSLAAYRLWADEPLSPENLRDLFLRYLAAFGPASVADFQVWAGMTRLREPIEALRPELCLYRDEQGSELFDLPALSLPDADTPAPVRFIPEYDNLMLAHQNRTRIMADVHRPFIFLSSARVRAIFLVDGFARGTWKIERQKQTAALIVEPFSPLSAAEQVNLSEEGERLLRFVEPDAATYAMRMTD